MFKDNPLLPNYDPTLDMSRKEESSYATTVTKSDLLYRVFRRSVNEGHYLLLFADLSNHVTEESYMKRLRSKTAVILLIHLNS